MTVLSQPSRLSGFVLRRRLGRLLIGIQARRYGHQDRCLKRIGIGLIDKLQELWREVGDDGVRRAAYRGG